MICKICLSLKRFAVLSVFKYWCKATAYGSWQRFFIEVSKSPVHPPPFVIKRGDLVEKIKQTAPNCGNCCEISAALITGWHVYEKLKWKIESSCWFCLHRSKVDVCTFGACNAYSLCCDTDRSLAKDRRSVKRSLIDAAARGYYF